MKKIFIALFLIILIVPFVHVKGQTGNLSISQTNNDSIIDIKVYLKRTGATSWNLGFASLVINYNFVSLNSPAEIGEGIWDNNSNFQYDDQIITSYDSNKSISIELGLNSPALGTTVPVDSILVGIIRFNISNPIQNHNIEWNSIYSSIIDNNGNDITSNMNFYNPPNTPLPVELTSFTYLINGNTVHLNWVTANEINNYGFEIQRKNSDNNIWNSIGFVQGSINSNQIKNYEYEDKNLIKGIYLYRLKQLDLNGNFSFFNLNSFIEINNPEKFNLAQNFPNPFNPNTVINFNNPTDNNLKLSVYDLSGKLIKILLNEFKQAGYYSVNFNGSGLSSGNYIYELTNGKEKSIKFMSLIK